MKYFNKTQRLKELRLELSNTKAPMLSMEDHEEVSDRYQQALEVGYYKEELRNEIEAIKAMSYKEFDERYNSTILDEVEEYNSKHGDEWEQEDIELERRYFEDEED